MNDGDDTSDHQIQRDEGRRAIAEVAKDGLPSLVGTIAGAVGGPVATVVGTLSALGVVKGTGALVRLRLRRGRRSSGFWRAYTREAARSVRVGGGMSAEALDLLLTAHRAAMDAPSDEAAPYLGRLVALYIDRPHDGFYRRTSRVLADLAGDDVRELVMLTRTIMTSPDLEELKRDGVQVHALDVLADRWRGGQQSPWALAQVIGASGKFEQRAIDVRQPKWPELRHWKRLFEVLKVHGLGREPDNNPWSGPGEHAVQLLMDDVYRLGVLFEVGLHDPSR